MNSAAAGWAQGVPASLALALAIAVAAPASALEVDLPFACRSVPVYPYAGVSFLKKPATPTTIAATATVHRLDEGEDITIPGGAASCFYRTRETGRYCFHVRGAANMLHITAVPSNNLKGAPACR